MSTVYRVDRAVATDGPAAAGWGEFEAQLRAGAGRHLTGRPGWFLLDGLDHLTEPQARRFVERVAGLLGEPRPHDRGGGLIRDVVDRGAPLRASSTVRYSDTRQGGNLHTDGCHRPGPVPDLFTLYCVRPAPRGGALVLVHVEDLLDELRGQPGVLEALRQPVHFDTRDDTPPWTVVRPVLAADRIHYLREYITSGHQRPGVPPLSADQVSALDALDALLDRPDLQTRRRLRPGEMIVVNNRAIVHGRTEFPAQRGPHARLLLRVWIGAPS